MESIFDEIHPSPGTSFFGAAKTKSSSVFTCKASTKMDENGEVDLHIQSTVGNIAALWIETLVFKCTDSSLDLKCHC